jgi:phenylacetate-CoA ligase
MKTDDDTPDLPTAAVFDPMSAQLAEYFDLLETRGPADREQALMQSLSQQLAHAQRHAPAFAIALAGVDAAQVNSRAALARLPVTRKHELLERQHAADAPDVFGGFSALGWGSTPAARRALRVFASPGPIYEPEGTGSDYWRMARALFAAGLRAGDLVHNSFSYHLTPAGAMMESGAHAIGCTVFPGGTGQTEQQVQAMAALAPAAYTGTPSFLKIMLEKADELGIALPSLTKASVGGEAFTPSLRDWFLARGVSAFQSYGTADLGLIAYETSARQGLVIDEGVIVEIVRPGTGDVAAVGEVGEVVVTTLNPGYPLIRFGTGDLSAMLPGPCPTGRTNSRIKGWMGRADQTAKVRGMFVHPAQVAEIVRRHAAVLRARLVVSGEMANDAMALHVEVEGTPEGLAAQLTEAIREVTKLRGDVRLCAPGSLPNDGKVIEDARRYT